MRLGDVLISLILIFVNVSQIYGYNYICIGTKTQDERDTATNECGIEQNLFCKRVFGRDDGRGSEKNSRLLCKPKTEAEAEMRVESKTFQQCCQKKGLDSVHAFDEKW